MFLNVRLNDATLTDLARQLGDIVACLRRDIPPQKRCGNVRLPQGDFEDQGVPLTD